MKIVKVAVMEETLVKELRSMCKDFGLTKYSKANRATLIGMICDYYSEHLIDMTAAELRKICGSLGITGVGKTRKDDIVAKIMAYVTSPVDSDSTEEIVEEIVDISSDDTVEEAAIQSTTNNNTVTVICGARVRNIEHVEGDTIWSIHGRMMNEMGIPAHPTFHVNHSDAPNNTIIEPGDEIEFFKLNGSKGLFTNMIDFIKKYFTA